MLRIVPRRCPLPLPTSTPRPGQPCPSGLGSRADLGPGQVPGDRRGGSRAELSTGFRARHVGIPWAEIVGMRNRLVHACFQIDYEQVWKTLTEDLPPLIEELATILSTEFGGDA
jgi:hypothetical protein